MLEFRLYCNDDDDDYPYEDYENNFTDPGTKTYTGDRLKKGREYKPNN